MRTLVRAMQTLWRSELDRAIGKRGILSGLFDASAITCGVITGGVAAASDMSASLAAAAALGGGLINPLIKLFGNIVGNRGTAATSRAVATHFMALEG